MEIMMKKTLFLTALICYFNLANAAGVDEFKEDYIRQLPEIQKEAEKGNPNAQAILGTMYKYGWGVERNDKQAYELLEKSSNQGNEMAQNNLAGLYIRDNTKDNDQQALQLLEKSAEKNNVAANFNLGVMYENGYGTTVDLKKAEYYFERAASQGNQRAKEALENVRNRIKNQ